MVLSSLMIETVCSSSGMSYHNRYNVEDIKMHKRLQKGLINSFRFYYCSWQDMYLEQCFFNIKKVQEVAGLDLGSFEINSRSWMLGTFQNIFQSE